MYTSLTVHAHTVTQVRLTLLVVSVIGWVVLLAGVGMASKAIVNASK